MDRKEAQTKRDSNNEAPSIFISVSGDSNALMGALRGSRAEATDHAKEARCLYEWLCLLGINHREALRTSLKCVYDYAPYVDFEGDS